MKGNFQNPEFSLMTALYEMVAFLMKLRIMDCGG